MIILRQKEFGIAERLAGRKTYYKGVPKEDSEKIKNSELKYTGVNKKDLKSRGWNPDDFKNKIYLTKDKKFAKDYANGIICDDGDVLEISVPYEVHRSWNKVANPERINNGIAHLHTKDDMSRKFLGKPYQEASKEDKKKLKEAKKYADTEIVLENTTIPSKYIKGSKDYQHVTPKEILKYQKAKLTGNYKNYDN